MPSLLIKNGRVIDPAQGVDTALDVLLVDGRIVEVAQPGKVRFRAEETLDAKRHVVAPGLIDLHVHLREPGQPHKETIASGTRAAAAGGFTSVCAMPNTQPVNDTPEITAWMRRPERGAVVNVFPIAAATVGSAGEKLTDFSALRRAGAVAVTDDGKPILDDHVMREALRAAALAGMPVVQHAEDTRQTAGASMNAGATAFRLGLRGWPGRAEVDIVERDIRLAAETGAHLHVAHLSTAGGLEAVREGKKRKVQVTCEVAPHHFMLTEEAVGDYDTNFKMNPPLRAAADRDAIIAGLLDGSVDAIATDHAPHAWNEKQQEFERAPFGITGLETALGLTLAELHYKRKMPLARVIELLSANPAKIAGLVDRGSVTLGFHGDVTIVDPNATWRYAAATSLSKSKNSPFDGWTMRGRVRATVVSGRVVYRA